jgi:CheY-like chemotaxis protein
MIPPSLAPSAPAEEHVRPERASAARRRRRRERDRPTVLLVDDDVDLRELYAWCMRAAGWQVETASNGAAAIIVADAVEPDAIVMDRRMPVLGGLEAIPLLKQRSSLDGVPVVVCTVSREPGDEAAAKAAGCVEFIVKPCPPERLRDAVARHLEE